MAELSPASQAILDAANRAYGIHESLEPVIAAALHALALRIKGADSIVADVLDIAFELEGIE